MKICDNIFDLKEETEIFRVCTVDRFLQILESKKLTLVRAKIWDDPFENFLLKSKGKTNNGRVVNFDQIREKFYGQCWTLTTESDGMWRSYAPHNNGVKLKTTVSKLFESFYDITNKYYELSYFIGRVKYYSESDLRQLVEKPGYLKSCFDHSGKQLCKTALIKREEFFYEQEARLIFIAPTEDPEPQVKNPWNHNSDFFNFAVNPSDIFSEVILDPRMSENLVESFTNIFRILEYNGLIQKSELYKEPYLWAPFE